MSHLLPQRADSGASPPTIFAVLAAQARARTGTERWMTAVGGPWIV